MKPKEIITITQQVGELPKFKEFEEFDANGSILNKTIYDDNFTVELTTSYCYHPNGKLRQKTEINADGDQLKKKCSMKTEILLKF